MADEAQQIPTGQTLKENQTGVDWRFQLSFLRFSYFQYSDSTTPHPSTDWSAVLSQFSLVQNSGTLTCCMTSPVVGRNTQGSSSLVEFLRLLFLFSVLPICHNLNSWVPGAGGAFVPITRHERIYSQSSQRLHNFCLCCYGGNRSSDGPSGTALHESGRVGDASSPCLEHQGQVHLYWSVSEQPQSTLQRCCDTSISLCRVLGM